MGCGCKQKWWASFGWKNVLHGSSSIKVFVSPFPLNGIFHHPDHLCACVSVSVCACLCTSVLLSVYLTCVLILVSLFSYSPVDTCVIRVAAVCTPVCVFVNVIACECAVLFVLVLVSAGLGWVLKMSWSLECLALNVSVIAIVYVDIKYKVFGALATVNHLCSHCNYCHYPPTLYHLFRTFALIFV